MDRLARAARAVAALAFALSPLVGVLAPSRVLGLDVGTFTVSFSGPDASGSFSGPCGDFSGGSSVHSPADAPGTPKADVYWSVSLAGDGNSLEFDVKPYHGPSDYTGGGNDLTVTGSFETPSNNWRPFGSGSNGTLTVNRDERSGSIHWTMAPAPSAPAGTAPLHLTASFDCPIEAPSQAPSACPNPTSGTANAAIAAPSADAGGCGEDLSIDHIEVVQVLQTPTDSIPLVSNKATVVRVFVKKDSGPERVEPLQGQLNGFVAGQLQPETLSPLTGSAFVGVTTTARSSSDGALMFRLPLTWTNGSTLQLDAIVDPVPPATDPNEANNSSSITVTLNDTPTLDVGWHGICLPTLPSDPNGCPTEATLTANAAGWAIPAQDMFPIRDGGMHVFRLPGPNWQYPERITDDASTEKALAWLKSMYSLAADIAFEQGKHGLDQLVGVVSGTGRAGWAGVSPGANDPKVGRRVLMMGEQESGFVLAHELGHNLGINHVDDPCRHPAGPLDTLSSGSADIGEVGVEIDGRNVKVVGTGTKDIMSYCLDPKWIAPEHYRTLLSNNLAPPLPKAGIVATRAAATPVAAAYVEIRGTVSADGSSGSIDGATAFNAQSAPPDVLTASSGRFCLSIAAPAGGSHGCFDPAFHSENQATTASASFAYVLPVPAGATAISLSVGSERPLATTKVGSAAPVVSVDPIASTTWSSAQDLAYQVSDPDNDPVTAVVLYSPDDGATWLPYASDPTGRLHVDVSQLQDGSTNLFRILASDGLHATTKDIGPITIPAGVGVISVIPPDTEPATVAAPTDAPGPVASSAPTSSFTPPGDGVPPEVVALVVVVVVAFGLVGVLLVGRSSRRRRLQAPIGSATTGGWGPASAQGPAAAWYQAPPSGLPAWPSPDASAPPQAQVPAGAPLIVLEWLPTGWARVEAGNGWVGWVDGRQLLTPPR